jgi:hypothetical protein
MRVGITKGEESTISGKMNYSEEIGIGCRSRITHPFVPKRRPIIHNGNLAILYSDTACIDDQTVIRRVGVVDEWMNMKDKKAGTRITDLRLRHSCLY